MKTIKQLEERIKDLELEIVSLEDEREEARMKAEDIAREQRQHQHD